MMTANKKYIYLIDLAESDSLHSYVCISFRSQTHDLAVACVMLCCFNMASWLLCKHTRHFQVKWRVIYPRFQLSSCMCVCVWVGERDRVLSI